MASIGKGFEGTIGYGVEVAYGTDPAEESRARFGDFVRSVSLRVLDRFVNHHTIDTSAISARTANIADYELTVEWLIQEDSKTILDECIKRTNDELDSLTIEIGANVEQSTKSYFKCVGCKCKSIEIKAGRGEPYVATAVFSVKDVTVGTSGTALADASESAVSTFNAAGGITKGGAAVAYIVDSVTITVDNGCEDYFDIGSATKSICVAGALSVTGTSDISLDDGGGVQVTDVMAGAEGDIVLSLGGAGAVELTLSDAVYDSIEVSLNDTAAGMITSVPFTAKTITVGSVSA